MPPVEDGSRSIRDSIAKNVYVKQIGFATGENLYSVNTTFGGRR